MYYEKMTERELDRVVSGYIDYYNGAEGGCWTRDKAYKRIHQVMTTEDSLCLVQYDDAGGMTGFAMGYYKVYDDLLGYFLEEIVIFREYQNQGYGSALLAKIEETVRENNAELIELLSVNDEHHAHFYQKAGFYTAKNLIVMGKHRMPS